MLISFMDGSSLAVPKTPQFWHIAMPVEEPSTASFAEVDEQQQLYGWLPISVDQRPICIEERIRAAKFADVAEVAD